MHRFAAVSTLRPNQRIGADRGLQLQRTLRSPGEALREAISVPGFVYARQTNRQLQRQHGYHELLQPFSRSTGPAAFDRRHNLVFSSSANLWRGLTLGAIWSLRSSLPFTALAGTDLNNDGALTDYVPGTSKQVWDGDNSLNIVNAWRATKSLAPIPLSQIQTNKYDQLDLRISKEFALGERFKVQAIGQLFNVFGTDNYGGIGTTQVTKCFLTGSARPHPGPSEHSPPPLLRVSTGRAGCTALSSSSRYPLPEEKPGWQWRKAIQRWATGENESTPSALFPPQKRMRPRNLK